tara:strand:- start:318 stop:596 length:279 start_codon:yes stop_codon:yes gene_type:complete
MGTALIKLKIMPTSPEVNLEELQKKVEEILSIEAIEGMKITHEKEPIAFGLTALISGFAMDESKQVDPIQEKITALENVNSAEVADFRRAFG